MIDTDKPQDPYCSQDSSARALATCRRTPTSAPSEACSLDFSVKQRTIARCRLAKAARRLCTATEKTRATSGIRPSGIRPSGIRPSGIRPSGAAPTRDFETSTRSMTTRPKPPLRSKVSAAGASDRASRRRTTASCRKSTPFSAASGGKKVDNRSVIQAQDSTRRCASTRSRTANDKPPAPLLAPLFCLEQHDETSTSRPRTNS